MQEKLVRQIGHMREAGIEFDQIFNLIKLKRQVNIGQRSEMTQEHRRLVFIRYLYEIGKITQ